MSINEKNEIKERKKKYKEYKHLIFFDEFNVIEDFSEYKKQRGILDKTINSQKKILYRVISILKKKARFWNKKDALYVYQKIYDIPVYLMHNKKFKDKPLHCVFKSLIGQEYKKISDETAKKYLNLIKEFFIWLMGYGHTTHSVFDKINPKKKLIKENESRSEYKEEDLETIFSDELFHNKSNARSFTYWIPIIGVLLGMRQGEIAQLYRQDIKFKDGIWYISIRNNFIGQRLKNKKAIRDIPIPRVLIKLGFIDFVESIDEGSIFKDIKRCERDGYGRDVSKWFSKKKLKWGFGKEYVFYSFRHYLINRLKQNDVELCIGSEITGHSYDSVAFERYGKDFSLKKKKKILDKNTSKIIKKLPRIYPRKSMINIFSGFTKRKLNI